MLTGMRSAAPLAVQSYKVLPQAFEQYWNEGTVTPRKDDELWPNPMIASLLSDSKVLHYGTDPVLGFHLATAFAPLAANSPLGPGASESAFEPAAAAQKQFTEWISAFRSSLERGTVVRFVVSDVFALCYTLQNATTGGGKTCANWYGRQLDGKPLKLDDEAYGGKEPEAPLAFDTIDTSNLSDHVGTLNLILATAPLLKEQPWATVYTDLLLKGQGSGEKVLEEVLCGDPATVSLLLGVSPVQYWTNAKVESHVDEVVMGMIAAKSDGHTKQLQTRLAWKRSDTFSDSPRGTSALHFESQTLSKMLYQIYCRMFQAEELDSPADIHTARAAQYPIFHRGSFAVFLKHVQQRVATDWEATCTDLVAKVYSRDTSFGTSNFYLDDFSSQLHLSGFTDMRLLKNIEHYPSRGALKGWKEVPVVVAISLVIPREAMTRLYTGSQHRKVASPLLVGSLRSPDSAIDEWHSFYNDVQLVWGTLKATPSDETGESSVSIEPDTLGWEGTSPMIAAFYVPASTLQSDPEKGVVGLSVPLNATSAQVYGPVLGMRMSVFEESLDGSNVYVSRFLPGQAGYPKICEAVKTLEPESADEARETKTKVVPDVSLSESTIQSIVGHLDILSDEGRKLLQNKVPMELRQRSPFVIEIVFLGKKKVVFPIRFPVPVSKEGSKTRVARTTSYVEVVAPLANPSPSSPFSQALSDFMFPVALSTSKLPVGLNMPHVNLDKLPILDLDKKNEMSWLTTLSSLQFSTRERKIREGRDDASSKGMANDVRVNFKETLLTMLMLSSGLQGGQTGLFALNHEEKGGIHILILVSAMRIDGDTASVVMDAAVIPFTHALVQSPKMQSFLLLLRELEIASTNVDDEELTLWKKVLPSLAERCRTWSHGPRCEYKKPGATVPLSLGDGEQLLCSCGNGHLPENYLGLPEWDEAARHATRVAISPTFAVPFVEAVADTSTFAKDIASNTSSTSSDEGLVGGERCRSCGKTRAEDGGALKKCMRCLEVKYCSATCQKKDWKTHRGECKEA